MFSGGGQLHPGGRQDAGKSVTDSNGIRDFSHTRPVPGGYPQMPTGRLPTALRLTHRAYFAGDSFRLHNDIRSQPPRHPQLRINDPQHQRISGSDDFQQATVTNTQSPQLNLSIALTTQANTAIKTGSSVTQAEI